MQDRPSSLKIESCEELKEEQPTVFIESSKDETFGRILKNTHPLIFCGI